MSFRNFLIARLFLGQRLRFTRYIQRGTYLVVSEVWLKAKDAFYVTTCGHAGSTTSKALSGLETLKASQARIRTSTESRLTPGFLEAL